MGVTSSSCLKIEAGKMDPTTAKEKKTIKIILETRIDVASLLQVNHKLFHLILFRELFIHLFWNLTCLSEQGGVKKRWIVKNGKLIEHINVLKDKIITKIIRYIWNMLNFRHSSIKRIKIPNDTRYPAVGLENKAWRKEINNGLHFFKKQKGNVDTLSWFSSSKNSWSFIYDIDVEPESAWLWFVFLFMHLQYENNS